MKFGKALQERTTPQWTPYIIDYDELKHLIKVNTTKDQGQAIAIPGHVDSALAKFEDQFFRELCNQHDRVDLFVKSKADEFNRKIREYQKRSIHLIAQCQIENGGKLTGKRRERFSRMETKIMSCAEDIRNLEKFVDFQRTAFQKIMKKYKKWTKSPTLQTKFTEEVLSSPKSFTDYDFSALNVQCNNLLTLLRTSTPPASGINTPLTQSRRASHAEARRVAEVVRMEAETREPQQQQGYWNEYDNGSEAGDADQPYTIYIDPEADDSFPGSKAVVYVINRAKKPFASMKGWFSPTGHPSERTALLGHNNGITSYFDSRGGSTVGTDTEFDDDTSSNEFPAGYETHYATFPSVADQKLAVQQEKYLFWTTMASFLTSFILLLVAGILIATGRHRLRVEVDAGVTVGVVGALFFATLGLSIMLLRWARCGWIQRIAVTLAFIVDCIASGMLLVLVMGNTAG